jgi:hypothetical protein
MSHGGVMKGLGKDCAPISTFAVEFLGRARVSAGGRELAMSRQCLSLLAYLALHREIDQPREILLELFWADQEPSRARSSLGSALWRLDHRTDSTGGRMKLRAQVRVYTNDIAQRAPDNGIWACAMSAVRVSNLRARPRSVSPNQVQCCTTTEDEVVAVLDLREEQPVLAARIDIKVVLSDPALRELEVPSIGGLIADGSHDARRFSRFEDDDDCVRLGPFEIRVDEVVTAALRRFDNRDIEFMATSRLQSWQPDRSGYFSPPTGFFAVAQDPSSGSGAGISRAEPLASQKRPLAERDKRERRFSF